MNEFTYGIMVIDPSIEHKDGHSSIVHFVGYWEKPTEIDFNSLKEELRTDDEFGLTKVASNLRYCYATHEVVDYYNSLTHSHENN